MGDLLSAVKESNPERYKTVVKVVLQGSETENVEKLLTQCKLFIALFGSEDTNGKLVKDFIEDAEKAILSCVDFVSGETELDAHETLLRKVARRSIRKPRTHIYTTNYDLCFETAAQRQRFTILDGFSYTLPQVYDRSYFSLDIVRRDGSVEGPDYVENVFHLYKLHGSLDWRRIDGEVVRDRGEEGEPVLIYPRDSKYQEAFEPPYLDMMGSFQARLREPDTTLIVSGFGFNDAHISQPIISALESNMSFRLVVCAPSFLDEKDVEKVDDISITSSMAQSNIFFQKMIKLSDAGDHRVVLLNGRFEDLADAIPDLIAETERERHATRIRTLREVE